MFLSAETITGNRDPTAHTTLSQTNIEGYVMGFRARFPMRPDNRGEMDVELAGSIELLDADRRKITLTEGTAFHDGVSFDAKGAKAAVECAAQLDRRRNGVRGPTGSGPSPTGFAAENARLKHGLQGAQMERDMP